MHSSSRIRLTTAAAALVLVGCQSATPHPVPGSSHLPGANNPSGNHPKITASDASNNHTIPMAIGETLVVTLHSTYWHLTPLPAGAAVQATGPASVVSSRRARCMPGQGCGTTTESFRATHAGRVVITAHRTSCGEARHCPPTSASYHLAVIVG